MRGSLAQGIRLAPGAVGLAMSERREAARVEWLPTSNSNHKHSLFSGGPDSALTSVNQTELGRFHSREIAKCLGGIRNENAVIPEGMSFPYGFGDELKPALAW